MVKVKYTKQGENKSYLWFYKGLKKHYIVKMESTCVDVLDK